MSPLGPGSSARRDPVSPWACYSTYRASPTDPIERYRAAMREEYPFSPETVAWFEKELGSATEVQRLGWHRIAGGGHCLLLAPTGSGKTLAAFLYAIDRLLALSADEPAGVRVLYISPLKALAHDVEKNLQRPLEGIAERRRQAGTARRSVSVQSRTGDTSQRDRARQRRNPADILVTTPESLFLLLTSQARETLRSVQTVIVDEIHVMASSKRGTHLALSLERLSALAAHEPQRIGLSATVNPADAVARFLGGDRKVSIVDTSAPPRLDLQVVVPVPDMTSMQISGPGPSLVPATSPGRHESEELVDGADKGIWAAIYPRLLDCITRHRSTLIFVNSRGLCERLSRRLNALSGRELVQAHHGSVSHERRAQIEEQLKSGELPALVATSSLELGIDMGAIDLVVAIESPGSVSRGLQRVGRAGHQVDATSLGRIFPKFRGDLLEATTVARGMVRGELESIRIPRNVLDVLAQQVVALCVDTEKTLDEIYALVTRADPYRDLPREGLASVVEMLSGHYPSNELADLRPRLSWDRERDVLVARKGARLVTLLNGGTIPDRGLFRVQLGPGGPKVGELDEEMVFESRPGDTIALGASTWRVEEISHDRVIVSPAAGEAGRLPFWRGDGIGRPVELGVRQGQLLEELASRSRSDALDWSKRELPLDDHAAENLVDYVHDQKEHAGVVPNHETLLAESFRDELGDWRLCLLSPFGSRVHAPLAIAAQAKLAALTGVEIQVTYNNDGLVWQTVEYDDIPDIASFLPHYDEVEALVTEHVGRSALFASMFRENAGRSLLLTRRSADGRNPLWAQRLKSKNLLGVVQRYPRFPIVLETYRQCLQDIFDLPGTIELLKRIDSGQVRIEKRETQSPSPFATSLVFEHVSQLLYETDAPAAETRMRALSLDRRLLHELLGEAVERDLVEPDVLADLESRLQRTHPERRARDADEVHDLLRELGALKREEIACRCAFDAEHGIDQLFEQRRICRVGKGHLAAVENAGLYSAALGWEVGEAALPLRAGESHPVLTLVSMLAARRGPFSAEMMATELGVSPALLTPTLEKLESDGVLISGSLRPDSADRQWCDREIWRRLRRITLARLRKKVQPVESADYARFLGRHQRVFEKRRGIDGLEATLRQLEGVGLPWSVWVDDVLPTRVADFETSMLDTLCGSGSWLWRGLGRLGARDVRVAFYRAEKFALLTSDPSAEPPKSDSPADRVLNALREKGAMFAAELGGLGTPQEIESALFELARAGWVRNDTVGPLLRMRAGRARSRRRVVRSADGRWSAFRDVGPNDATHVRLAWSDALLDRYGLLGRDTVATESVPGGFQALYELLREMEDQGFVRRGTFVRDMTGIQFASTGSVDALRDSREGPEVYSLAALDPAQPYGSVLPWPDPMGAVQPRWVAGATMVLVRGRAALYIASNRRELITFTSEEADTLDALQFLSLSRFSGRRMLAIDRVDGVAAREWNRAGLLLQAGFVSDHRGFVSTAV